MDLFLVSIFVMDDGLVKKRQVQARALVVFAFVSCKLRTKNAKQIINNTFVLARRYFPTRTDIETRQLAFKNISK